MPSSIVDIKNMGDAFRNTGYKNIESAAAEIVDNSVEANAKNVFVILSESINQLSGRKVVTEMGFLDDGDGMNDTILGSCLGIGSTTRQARRGMGRFGVGLPQASLHACPKVTVYSWQNGIENCKKVFLDINMVKDGTQTEIEDPVLEALPEKYAQYIQYRTLTDEYDFSESGTLVIWTNCDRVKPRTRGPLTEHLEFSLGQKFRYFIHDNITKIKIICDENQENAIDVLPNDPLFLMNDNLVLGEESDPKKIYRYGQNINAEPVFEPYRTPGNDTGELVIPIKYIDKNGEVAESSITAKFSIVKAKFYDETAFPSGNPGSYAFGQHAKKLEGISVVRANREIDFGQFDFYSSTNEPQHRWWGCEIRFTPELDEAFGVANNKQYVDLKKIAEDDIDIEEEVQPIWTQICDIISSTIKAMYAQNEETRSNTRTPEEMTDTPAVNIINQAESFEVEDDDDDEVVDPFENATEEEIIDAGRVELENLGFENVTDEQATNFFNNKVVFDYSDKGERAPAFDYRSSFGTTTVTINTTHKFYTTFLNKVYGNPDAKTTFELFLGSFFRAIEKLNTYQRDENDKLITLWYNKLNNYISEQMSPRDTK